VYSNIGGEALAVRGLPGLLLKSRGSGVLVVGDLHIGFERELAMQGIHPTSQWRRLFRKIVKASIRLKADTLVILGDLKHDVLGGGRRELAEAGRLLRELGEAFKEVVVVRGNHDGLIGETIKSLGMSNIRLEEAKGFLMDRVYLMHGHAAPDDKLMESKLVILAHAHPVSPGKRGKVLVKGRIQLMDEKSLPFLIIPAMSYLVPGLDYSKAIEFLPLLRRSKASVTEVYTMEG